MEESITQPSLPSNFPTAEYSHASSLQRETFIWFPWIQASLIQKKINTACGPQDQSTEYNAPFTSILKSNHGPPWEPGTTSLSLLCCCSKISPLSFPCWNGTLDWYKTPTCRHLNKTTLSSSFQPLHKSLLGRWLCNAGSVRVLRTTVMGTFR